ncbi:hypothetical protein ESA94_19770 [Lacibacter luteus]|uniref:TIGR04255 family protein n=1 Tax=Lacibacter luteus TaxID=2508719 RepID=A0A4Q1CDS5_9BACT|nr:hypothetical protein [Lacibacter luteus]RXK57760.1 hypothetical protein ESA94_19770 [Lacibacter luteus]
MIDLSIRYQVAIFGSFEDISPKPDTLKYFIDSFSDKELIPVTAQEINLLNPTNPINRLSLKSTDEVWSIEFSSSRIDIIKSNKDVGVVDMNTLDIFLEEAKKIVDVINTRFPKKFNRLSLVTRYLLPEMTKDSIAAIFHKNCNTINFFKEYEPVEWKNRVVTRIPITIQDEENINVISEINRIIGNLKINSQNQEIDRVELKFDINTFQGSTEFRFTITELIKFLDFALSLESDLKDQYEKMLN